MREIKFRVWWKLKKRWVKPEDLTNPYVVTIDLTENGFTFKKNSGFIYCQYIELKDRNGKEIYEGDILFNPYDKNNYEIIWDEMQGAFSLGENGCMLRSYCLNKFWEIIGNIHQNPELLKLHNNK